MLVISDTRLNKQYASQMALVTCHWSGKQHAVAHGIHLISLVRTEVMRTCRVTLWRNGTKLA
jgi:hypothetical protein